jgi:hypothetical protein
MTLTTK